jgi:hypothetical protein
LLSEALRRIRLPLWGKRRVRELWASLHLDRRSQEIGQVSPRPRALGRVEGHNLAFEYRLADNQEDRLAALEANTR